MGIGLFFKFRYFRSLNYIILTQAPAVIATRMAFLLAALMLLQALGWQTAWLAAWINVRKTAETEQHETCQRTLSRSDYFNLKIGRREISLAGTMFDIDAVEAKGDSLVLTLHADQKETRHYAALRDFLQPQSGNSGENTPLHFWWQGWRSNLFIGHSIPFPTLPAIMPLQDHVFCYHMAKSALPASPPDQPPKA
ncbi:MAG: hypothetical protein IPL65_08125 [Lewinellaceae bacterium]|nr:hypothetical protein [Lewinellaceae bacterium]